MAYVQTEWDKRMERAAKARHCPEQPVDTHMLRLRAEGYSNQQIAELTGRKIWDVNLELGPNELKGR